jgi:hypothetical protein
MNIYTSEKALPYVYRLDNPVTGEIYIGYREANKLPSHLDLPEYRTSSKYVEPRFDEFNWTIVAEFFLGDDAYDHEQFSIYENWGNPLLMNGNCFYGKKRLKTLPQSQETKDKRAKALTGKKRTDETKAKMSAAATGKKHSAERLAINSSSHKGLYQSQETKDKRAKALTGIQQKIVKCPHCTISGGSRAMKRWHFDNCKSRVLISVLEL